MKIIFIGVLTMVLSSVALATEKDMLAVVEQYEKAANTGDIKAFEKILALEDPQFSEYEGHVPDLIGKKGVYDILNWRKEHPEFKYKAVYSNRRAFLLSETTGYVTAICKSKSDHGENVSRVTFVMKRTDGEWRIIHGHWSNQLKPDKAE